MDQEAEGEGQRPGSSVESSDGSDGWSNLQPKQRPFLKEVKKQLKLAGPLIMSCLLQYCLQLISIMFVGHLGELTLAGASMATSLARVTGFSLMVGMASALDTLCGQSFGAQQYHTLGVHMQRAMAILLLVCIPLSIIWANTNSILILLGQDPDISREAGTYARFLIPSLFAYAVLQPLIKFLVTQNIVLPMMFSSGLTSLLHILVCWALVFKSGLGSRGAALATAISYWVNVLLLALYVKFSPSCSKTWTGFSREALHNVVTFIKLAVPSAVMGCVEMWSYELMVIMSGLLPNPKLETSVLSICLNTSTTVWMIPFGLGGAVSTRVSNELGGGNANRARLAVRVAMVMVLAEGIIIVTILILIRNVLGYVYSKEKEVVQYVALMTPILAVSCFFSGMQGVLSGIARGCGWQKNGAYVNIGAFYVVGIPSGIVMAFALHIGGKGLWLGIIFAAVVQDFCLLIITLRTNWDKQAKKATENVQLQS